MKDKNFQDIFKELRTEKKLSQDSIATELEVSPALISKWERNESTPAPEMLEYIADYFDVSVDYLIGRSKYRNLEFNNSELDNILIAKIKLLNDDAKMGLISVIDALNKN